MDADQGHAAFLGAKPKRVLACMLCHQRKIKCDRRFPCANCQKTNTQCIPAALLPRQRRRRFPERELLDRLRSYENLLQKHKIIFDPLHGTTAAQLATNVAEADDDSQDEAADRDGPTSKLGEKGQHSEGNAELAK